MPRIVIASDSFKGSLAAPEVCAAIGRGLTRAMRDPDLRMRPMADGGEGTLDAVLAAVGDAGGRHSTPVRGAGGATVVADYGLVTRAKGRTAIIEIAQAVGITDSVAMTTAVGDRSTLGVGELLRKLLDAGVRNFMVGLGGSSTNDGGAGLLCALGLALRDDAGRTLPPTPNALSALARIDATSIDRRLAECDITIMSDVNNRLTGSEGATAVFGPQKGVVPEEVPRFDAVLHRFAAMVEAATGRRAMDNPGAGAAGGLGFAFSLLGGVFASGADVVAGLIGLDAALADADWAITGEGRSDRQTLLHKAPFVVAQHAKARGVPVTLVSGAVDPSALAELDVHFAGCFGLPNGPAPLELCIADASRLLEDRALQLGRLFVAANAGRAL